MDARNALLDKFKEVFGLSLLKMEKEQLVWFIVLPKFFRIAEELVENFSVVSMKERNVDLDLYFL